MAYPIIRDITSGVISTTNSSSHQIPMPTIIDRDLVIVYISQNYPETVVAIDQVNSSSTWVGWGSRPPTGPHVVSNIDILNPELSCRLTYIFNWGVGGGADTLWLNSYYYSPEYDYNLNHYTINSRLSYVCYSISGIYNPTWSGYGNLIKSVVYSNTLGNGSNYNVPACPANDDSVIQEYLWIATVSAPSNNIATVAPSGFSGLLTAQGSTSDFDSSSLSSAYVTSNTTSRYSPGTFTSPSSRYCSHLIRLYPATASIPPPEIVNPSTSIGVGTYLYEKAAYAYVTPVDSIIVKPVDQYYNDDGSPDTTLNYYGYYVEVISSGAWTCAWNTGTYFTAGQYSGSVGVTYVAINCVGSNGSAGSYTDTLVFDGPGIASDSVNVEQYAAPS